MPRRQGLNRPRAKKKNVQVPQVVDDVPLPSMTISSLMSDQRPELQQLFCAPVELAEPEQPSEADAPLERVPDSPGMKQWREAELTAQQAANRLRISRKEACDASRDFLRASDLNDRKLKSIDRAFKRGLSGHKMLNKLWDADAALRMADRKRLHYKCKWAEAGWDAQIAINEAQSKRIRRLKRIIHSAKKSELQKVGS